MSGRKSQRAFTLIELLLVLVILVVLAAVVLPNLASKPKEAKIKAAKTQISTLETALSVYNTDVGDYPSTQQGLQALVEAPAGTKGWSGPYLTKTNVPNDPWGNPYIYVCPGQHNTSSFDLSSNGPDTGSPTPIDNWSQQ
jgi:general secretion pathway protein G